MNPLAERVITCPTCLDKFGWNDTELLEYSPKEGRYSPAVWPDHGNPAKVADARSRWYVRCPNPSKDSPNHYLPATYVDYDDPLVIALVGRPLSGKTHLVVAMIRELLGGSAAGAAGLTAKALDYHQHVTFKRTFLDTFEKGDKLPATLNESGTHLAWLVVEHGPVRRPLVFFDVAGEDFRASDENGRHTRFLVAAGALLFVEDAPHVLRNFAEAHDLAKDPSLSSPFGANATNEFIQEAINRLPGGGRHLPAVVALTKSDRLRYLAPADRWLRHEPGGRVDPADLVAESRDVYALLHRANATSMTKLYQDFRDCTMHFVSATGGAAGEDGRFGSGIRPMRVMVPLLSLLAMAGVVPVATRSQGVRR
ncbi:hypothetical protein [Amycolatopsis vancoresmycina]|uniref:Uncharacterized protein n=1 Tax=Amycolatopsis vancoresmycina DSM 44592 TaxID=1292037 RepID=R1G6N1_9PSEU|nr:hypothetical protein [Amycolatopsis vancoresmycina]EOD67117.1 hypothetical protein H480_18067 [Amycolatopsis vancoresmycina DSM 44592]